MRPRASTSERVFPGGSAGPRDPALSGHRPVVLLDDVVSELDERNRKMIFDFLQAHTFQVFITDVEERLLYRHLGAFTSFQVSQVNGQAELRRTPAPQRALCDVC